jgi:hypothetical protein
MRTVPTQITDGFTNNYTAFWVVKIEATDLDDSSTVNYYWTTASKNRTGHTFTLKWDSGTTVTPDATMIASRDLVTGETYDGIGAMESGADLYEGGGVATVSDLEVDILNQERFDETILQANIYMENRPITIYFGFIPDGSGQTVIISTQMLKRWAGVIEDLRDYDYQTFKLRCVDGSFQRHKDIPETLITLTNYPRAPKESIGVPVPSVYGAFYTDEDTERDFETISPAPGILIDDTKSQYIISSHACHTVGNTYFFSSDNGLFGKLDTPDNSSNTASGVTFDYATGGNLLATFRQVPKLPSSDTTATSPENSVDSSATSYTEVGVGKGVLWRYAARPQEAGTLADSTGDTTNAYITIRGYIGQVDNEEGSTVYLGYKQGASTSGTYLGEADENTIKTTSNAGLGVSTWDTFSTCAFGAGDAGATTMIVRIKHLVLEYYVVVANLRPGAKMAAMTFSGYGRRR